MGSFKVRLALYFALVALLPFAAAFQGFHALSKRSETSRVDSVLQTGLRSALAAYSFELDEAERDAAVLARRRSFRSWTSHTSNRSTNAASLPRSRG